MAKIPKKPSDDFKSPVKKAPAERFNYHCSICDAPTVGPKHGTKDKRFSLGKAAHIKAAAAGGPRYDANQTSEERSSIENGIWACAVCADLIDGDNDSYEVDELLRIKDGAEWQASTHAGRHPGSQLPGLKTPSTIQRAIEIFRNQEAARKERVDPRFNVAVRLKDGGPVYEYRAKEPVAARLSIHSGGQRQELEVLRTFMDYGGDLSPEGLNVQMEGSHLFPSGDFAIRSLHFVAVNSRRTPG
ncbi:MAG: hypothetical protein ACRYHA_19025 [Janthinobacterium lividum]